MQERGLDSTVVLSQAAIKKAAGGTGMTQKMPAPTDKSLQMAAPTKAAPARPAVDAELLDVFLEEAGEVLVTIETELANQGATIANARGKMLVESRALDDPPPARDPASGKRRAGGTASPGPTGDPG